MPEIGEALALIYDMLHVLAGRLPDADYEDFRDHVGRLSKLRHQVRTHLNHV